MWRINLKWWTVVIIWNFAKWHVSHNPRRRKVRKVADENSMPANV
jgi:hypothetical protein